MNGMATVTCPINKSIEIEFSLRKYEKKEKLRTTHCLLTKTLLTIFGVLFSAMGAFIGCLFE